MLTEPVLIGVIDNLPFHGVVVDLPSNTLERIIFLQGVFNVTCGGTMCARQNKRKNEAERHRAHGHLFLFADPPKPNGSNSCSAANFKHSDMRAIIGGGPLLPTRGPTHPISAARSQLRTEKRL